MTPSTSRTQAPPSWLVWTALWVVYIVWGSTYLAIRVTIETLPPLLTAGLRFMVAGAIVYLFLLLKRGRSGVAVSRREVGASALVGAALLFGGNGMVTLAERTVPSGLAALIIASVPLWVVLLRFIARERVSLGTLGGVIVGFIGVSILVVPSDRPAGATLGGMLLLVAASFSWASGSFFSKKLPLPRDAFLSTAVQMLAGGAVMFSAGLARGEMTGLDPSRFSGASIAAFIYLIFAGSLLAFTAYVWLLQNAPISKVATYAYVNPVIAILLGWLILKEEVTPLILVGAAVIVASVAAIVQKEAAPPAAEEPPAEPSAAPATDVPREPALGRASG